MPNLQHSVEFNLAWENYSTAYGTKRLFPSTYFQHLGCTVNSLISDYGVTCFVALDKALNHTGPTVSWCIKRQLLIISLWQRIRVLKEKICIRILAKRLEELVLPKYKCLVKCDFKAVLPCVVRKFFKHCNIKWTRGRKELLTQCINQSKQ